MDARDRWDVLEEAGDLSRQGEEFALATVVWRQSPSSAQLGSRAIITADGHLRGWIGGACAEPIVIREAQRVIQEGKARLLLLGTPEQFGSSVPEGMAVVPISCQSEGALQVYVEPVTPTITLTVIGRSPMAVTLGALAEALGWRAEVVDFADFDAGTLDDRSVVVVATQGHGDEDALEQAVKSQPAFIGLVASRNRGEGVLGYLADRGVPKQLLDRVQVPVGLPLGDTLHREIAVSILADLVQRRAAGELAPRTTRSTTTQGSSLRPPPHSAGHQHVDALDPVCGMTVRADAASYPVEREGTTYYFCCVGCRDSFERDPAAYVVHQEA